jgi:hypothetical protein
MYTRDSGDLLGFLLHGGFIFFTWIPAMNEKKITFTLNIPAAGSASCPWFSRC